MYNVTRNPELTPGTGLVEMYQQGMSGYVATQNYFATPAGEAGIRGMGGGCGCGCNGLGDGELTVCACKGVGAVGDGSTGLLNTGLFASTSPSDWGAGEWVALILGGYVVGSVLFTTKTAARATTRKTKAVRKALKA